MGSTCNDNHEFNDYEIIFRQFTSGISLMWNNMVTSSQSKVNFFGTFGELQELLASRVENYSP